MHEIKQMLLAVDARRVAHAYFSIYLPNMVGRLLIEDYRSLNTSFDVRLTDDENFLSRIVIREGRLAAIDSRDSDAEVGYILDCATLVEIVSGRVKPQDAFFDMRVEIEGDMETGLELGAVLEDFFHIYPYQHRY